MSPTVSRLHCRNPLAAGFGVQPSPSTLRRLRGLLTLSTEICGKKCGGLACNRRWWFIVSVCQTTLEGDNDRSNDLGDGWCAVGVRPAGVLVGWGASTMTAGKILLGFFITHVIVQTFIWWFANV